jgi:cytidine deaminase
MLIKKLNISQLFLLKIISIFYHIIGYGQNIDYIHAEKNAILNLPNVASNKLKKVNILIIRKSYNNTLTMSKPCLHCLYDMYNLARDKGYHIKKIYYSDNNGNIIKETLTNMMFDKNNHISKYYLNFSSK